MSVAFLFGLLLLLMLTGMPIAVALGLTTLTFFYTMTQIPIESVPGKLYNGIANFEIMAIPFFILAGNFLTHGGVARRMIKFATALVGHWFGGLGLAGVVACALFAAVSGSSPATVVAIGSILMPAMVKAGYPKRFGAGVVTTSGALGILIPPSIVMVMYSVTTNSSVGALFMAGVIPGLVMATMLGFTTWFIARRGNFPRHQMYPEHSALVATAWSMSGLLVSLLVTLVPPALIGWLLITLVPVLGKLWFVLVFIFWMILVNHLVKHRKMTLGLKFEALEVWSGYWDSVWGLMLILVVMGGIYSGLFTPTEAAAMSAVYAFFIAMFVYRDLSLRDLPKVLLNSASMSAMLLFIIANASLFSFLMTSEQIPQAMADWMLSQGLGVITFLIIANIMLLLAGNFMEPSSIILILAPILFPVAMKLGIDPIHFGIVMVVNMEVGMCHPPVGLNLYVASGITKMGITELTVAVWPWLLTMLAFLILVTYWPTLSLWLPQTLGMIH
jgi:C4-dicarboxylate transporter DctM subunit